MHIYTYMYIYTYTYISIYMYTDKPQIQFYKKNTYYLLTAKHACTKHLSLILISIIPALQMR